MRRCAQSLYKLLEKPSKLQSSGINLNSCQPLSTSTVMQSMSISPRPPPRGQGSLLTRLLKPTVFCVGASATYYAVAAHWDDRRRQEALKPFWQRQRRRPGRDPEWLHRLPAGLRDFYLEARSSWQNVPSEKKVVYGLIAANVAVHLLWKVPSLSRFMLRNFIQALPPQRTALHTMVTATFSHVSLTHLFCNMLALSSFGTTACQVMGKEQFLAFYMSAGLASSLGSFLGRIRSTTGGFSLGASGAVYACFALTATLYPESSAVFIFLPMVPIAMGTLLKLTMGLDAMGVVLGWKMLDHWGHLGGAGFGVWYTLQGHKLWQQRHRLLSSESQEEKRGKGQ